MTRQTRNQVPPVAGGNHDAVAARERDFKRIWQATHPDFRGELDDGTLSIISWTTFGGGLVTAQTISDAELQERLACVKARGVRR